MTTSRNSGVIHAGLYYPPGSRKARTCVDGKRLLYAWAHEHDVAHARLGKLVVARTAEQVPALEQLLANARACGVDDCELVDGARARALEPALPEVLAALWSPSTGIVDPHALTRSYLVDAERHGATFVHHAAVRRIEPAPAGFALDTGRGTVEVTWVINAAGLFADEVAAMVGYARPIRACRGDYFRLRTNAHYGHLVYPVKGPNDPGLGVHLTIELDGAYRLGPDWTWVDDKHDYAPAPEKHAAFLAATRRLLGPVEADQLTYDGCGLRPKLVGPGEPAADFEIEQSPAGCIHLLGIESPGLTAALALADEVAAIVSGGRAPA